MFATRQNGTGGNFSGTLFACEQHPFICDPTYLVWEQEYLRDLEKEEEEQKKIQKVLQSSFVSF